MVEITRGIKYGDRTRLDNGLDSTLACDRWPFQVAVFHRKEQKKTFRNGKENKAQTIEYAMFDGYPIVACICLFN